MLFFSQYPCLLLMSTVFGIFGYVGKGLSNNFTKETLINYRVEEKKAAADNPLLAEWEGLYNGIAPFDKIAVSTPCLPGT